MANVQGNEEALTSVVVRTARRLGLDLGTDLSTERSLPVDVDRVWIPNQAGLVLGPTLGCLRYLPRSPDEAVRVDCGLAFELMLDPSWTAPNARIAVSLHSSLAGATYKILTPGSRWKVPNGFREFYCYNADQLNLFIGAVDGNWPIGFCAFLVGRSVGATEDLQHLASQAYSSIIWQGDMLQVNPFIPTANLQAVRMFILGLSATNAIRQAWFAAITAQVYAPYYAGVGNELLPESTTPESGISAGRICSYARGILSGRGVMDSANEPDMLEIEIPPETDLFHATASLVVGNDATPATKLMTIIQGVPSVGHQRQTRAHRTRKILYDDTSVVAGTLNPILRFLDKIHRATIHITAGGIPTVYTVAEVREDGTLSVIPGTSAPAVNIVDAIGPGMNVNRNVPSRMQVTVTAPAAQTVRLVVYGHFDD